MIFPLIYEFFQFLLRFPLYFLSPSIFSYVFYFPRFFLFRLNIKLYFFRETWTPLEDITLLEQSLSKNKSWSEISKTFPGRTQHTVKNRFLAVMGREMVLSRTAIRSLLKKQNNEQLIFEVLTKLKQGNTKEEPEINNETVMMCGLKRTQEDMGFEGPSGNAKKVKINNGLREGSLVGMETQSFKMTEYESPLQQENKDSNNLIDMLADKFNFWKEGEEEVEKKNFFVDDKKVNVGNALFNVDDFFSI